MTDKDVYKVFSQSNWKNEAVINHDRRPQEMAGCTSSHLIGETRGNPRKDNIESSQN